ncbi:BA14K family protein [Ensifer aridi]|uniref:BA14K family protein n=1 Tax=Ensifer aridi TaxID=1708715 RepID=UPI000A0FABAC|nr:BA14K family protein [Ensifer aridi]
MKRLAIVALSLATALISIGPAQAFPTVPAVKAQASDIQLTQNNARDHVPGWNPSNPRYCQYHNCRFFDRSGNPRFGSYRRYRDRDYYRYRDRGYYRRHYRDWDDDDDDFGAALGGFAAGAIIGGLLSQPPRAYYRGGGNSHANWCYARYRSYRAYDNTYQPYYGRRRQCISPYM